MLYGVRCYLRLNKIRKAHRFSTEAFLTLLDIMDYSTDEMASTSHN